MGGLKTDVFLKPRCPNCISKKDIVMQIKDNFGVYFCNTCQNAFTYPIPKNVSRYYPSYYWKGATHLDEIKKFMFRFLQERRIKYVERLADKGCILDVGAGEGRYFLSLSKRFNLISQEPQDSKVKNKQIIKKDFLSWDHKQKYDIVCFWESLEHTPQPQKYLTKAYSILKIRGKVIIEFPRYGCLESRILGKYWFHLDTPRHLAHLTNKGIVKILKRAGFNKIKQFQIFSPDYSPWGLMSSLFNIAGFDVTNYFKKTGNIPFFILLLPLAGVCFLLEFIVWLFNQSPISIVVAEKSSG